MYYLVTRAQVVAHVACTRNTEMTRAYLSEDAGTLRRPAWLATGGESDKREVCKGRGTLPKLTDAAKHPSKA